MGSRIVYILGEDHDMPEISTDKAKLLPSVGLPVETDSVYIVTETEDSRVFQTYKNKGDTQQQTQVNILPYCIESLLSCLIFLQAYKQSSTEDIEIENEYLSQILARTLCVFTKTGESEEHAYKSSFKFFVENGPHGYFLMCLKKLTQLCSLFEGQYPETREIYDLRVIKNLQRYDYESCLSTGFNTDLRKAFHLSRELVDFTLVKLLIDKNQNPTTPPEMSFIVIMGQEHVSNIKQMLLSSNQNFIVLSYNYDDPVLHEKRADNETITLSTKDFDFGIDVGVGKKKKKKSRTRKHKRPKRKSKSKRRQLQ
jgi:hypothetical protein